MIHLLPIALLALSPQDIPVDESLVAWLQEAYEGDTEKVRYFSAYADLNGDGREEAIVYVTGGGFCGSSGCQTHVLSPGKDGYEHVSSIGLTRPPIVAARTRTEGWRDLIVFVQGGGEVEGYDARLSAYGGTYPETPYDGESTERVVGKVEGDVLIARAIFDEGRPIPSPSRPIEPCRPDPELAWRRLESRGLKDGDLAEVVETFRQDCGLPLNFWAGPRTEESQLVAHPCGGVMERYAKTISPPEDPVAQPEVVYELGPSGEVLQRWWVPVDSVVDAIDGEDLLISLDVGMDVPMPVYLAVGHEGAFKVIPFRKLPEGNLIECPKSQGLPESNSLWCWEMIDQRGGKARRIAYDGPCT